MKSILAVLLISTVVLTGCNYENHREETGRYDVLINRLNLKSGSYFGDKGLRHLVETVLDTYENEGKEAAIQLIDEEKDNAKRDMRVLDSPLVNNYNVGVAIDDLRKLRRYISKNPSTNKFNSPVEEQNRTSKLLGDNFDPEKAEELLGLKKTNKTKEDTEQRRIEQEEREDARADKIIEQHEEARRREDVHNKRNNDHSSAIGTALGAYAFGAGMGWF